MDAQSKTMPSAMDHECFETVTREDLASGDIRRRTRHAGAYGGKTRQLRLEHRFVYLDETLVR